jgi:hypothetical protein
LGSEILQDGPGILPILVDLSVHLLLPVVYFGLWRVDDILELHLVVVFLQLLPLDLGGVEVQSVPWLVGWLRLRILLARLLLNPLEQ